MKKSAVVVGVVVVLAVAYAGSSWYVGKRAEDLVRRIVKTENGQLRQLGSSDASAVLAIDRYKRGVFSSDVVYSLTIRGSHDKDKPIVIKLADHLDHGPFPIADLKKGRLQPVMAISHAQLLPTDATQQWFDVRADKTHAPVWALTTLGFSGTGKSVWQFQPYKAPDGSVTFSGATATIDMSNQYRDGTLAAAFDDFGMKDDDDALRLRNVKIDSKTTTADSGTITSQARAVIGSIVQTPRRGPPMASKDWHLALAGTRTGDMLDGTADYQVGHIQSGATDLGSLRISAKVAHLDVKALDALNAAYAEAHSAKPTEAQQAALQEKALAFLATEPVVAIDNLDWKTAKGETTGKASLQLTRPKVSESADIVQAALQMVKGASLNVSLSKPMIEGLLAQGSAEDPAADKSAVNALMEQATTRLTRSGIARLDGDNLVSDLHYQDGKIDVNGTKMPFGRFLVLCYSLLLS